MADIFVSTHTHAYNESLKSFKEILKLPKSAPKQILNSLLVCMSAYFTNFQKCIFNVLKSWRLELKTYGAGGSNFNVLKNMYN